MLFRSDDHSVSFDASSFSVYVIIDHEGSTTVTTPRVEFHFISQTFTGTSNPYSAPPYNFPNKANPSTFQTSQILTNGEALEMIANPPNVTSYQYEATHDTAIVAGKDYFTYSSETGLYSPVTSPDVSHIGDYYEIVYHLTTDSEIVAGTTYYTHSGNGVYTPVASPNVSEIATYYVRAISERFFYGWYVVEKHSDSTAYNGSRWEGSISYSWPTNSASISKIAFEVPMTLTDASGNALTDQTTLTAAQGSTPGTELKWTINDVTNSGNLDEEGIIHVYLAPIYEDYYFVNFRMGALDDTSQGGAGLRNSLLTRRLVVFGKATSVSVRIGDIACPSTDPTHKVFVGWQTEEMHSHNQYYQTMDDSGHEINSTGSSTGYYITLNENDFIGTSYDLYPLFVEARWLSFNTGKSGNGASYVGSSYRLTNDEGLGTTFNNRFFNDNKSVRKGYTLEGWYAFVNQDTDGNITNLSSPQDVVVRYLDADGNVQSVTFNMQAIKLVKNVNDSYSLVAPTDNADIAHTTVGSTTYTLYADGGAFFLQIGSDSHKLFAVESSGLMFYKTVDDLTLYANWTPVVVEYKVLVWEQNANDDNYTLQCYNTFSAIAEDTATITTSGDNGRNINIAMTADTSYNRTYTLQNTTENTTDYVKDLRFVHFSTCDGMSGGTNNGVEIQGDGSTVINVYYDRNVYTLRFDIGFARRTSTSGTTPTYAAMTATEAASYSGTVYGVVDGNLVTLTSDGNGGWTYQIGRAHV